MLFNNMTVHGGRGELGNDLCKLLDFTIQDKHKSTTMPVRTLDYVPLKKLWLLHHKQSSFSSQACLRTWCQFLCTLTASPYGDEQCQMHRKSTQQSLRYHPADEDKSIVGIWKHSFAVSYIPNYSSVDDNTLQGHIKALVQALNPIRFGDVNQAVTEASEVPFSSSFADICC